MFFSGLTMTTGIWWVWVSTALLALSVCLSKSELRLVHVVFRHGERTPASTYRTDPYVNYAFEPFGWGELTNAGKLSQYQQGQFLRTRYNGFLGPTYTPDVMIAHSTDLDRTIMSAQLELAGLWPPDPKQRWNPSLKWQPIPVRAKPFLTEDMLLLLIKCPRYLYERARVKASAEIQEILKANNATELYKLLSEKTGESFKDPADVLDLHGTLTAESAFNLTLPEWTKEIFPDRLIPLSRFSFTLGTYNNELKKLQGGQLLKKILNDTISKADNTLKPEGRKMFMYSGHDTTVANLLSALKVWDPQIPAYNTMILIELHYNDTVDEHTIQVFLRNTTEHEPYHLTLPGCKTSCPLNQFIALTSSVIPENLTKSCELDDPNFEHSPIDDHLPYVV